MPTEHNEDEILALPDFLEFLFVRLELLVPIPLGQDLIARRNGAVHGLRDSF